MQGSQERIALLPSMLEVKLNADVVREMTATLPSKVQLSASQQGAVLASMMTLFLPLPQPAPAKINSLSPLT